MKTQIYFILCLLCRFSAQLESICEENKMNSVYYATKCCYVTLPRHDKEFMSCHAKYAKMARRPANKLNSSERIAINICAHECSLKKKGFLSAKYKGEFDTDAIDDFYTQQYAKKRIFSVYMIDTFSKCLKFDSAGEVNIKFPNVTFIDKECNPQAARIMMCIRTKAMQSCPPSAWNEWSVNCAAAKMYFKDCVGSIEKVVRNMD